MNTSKKVLTNRKNALIIAAAATLLNLIAFLTDLPVLLLIGIVAGIASYVMGGGFREAMEAGAKIAKVGWLIIPVFPIDFICGIMTVIMSFFIAFLMPVAFVFVSFLNAKKECI